MPKANDVGGVTERSCLYTAEACTAAQSIQNYLLLSWNIPTWTRKSQVTEKNYYMAENKEFSVSAVSGAQSCLDRYSGCAPSIYVYVVFWIMKLVQDKEVCIREQVVNNFTYYHAASPCQNTGIGLCE